MDAKKWFFFMGGEAALSVYPSTDKAILGGVGPSPSIGYVGTFGDSDNDPDDPNIIFTVGRWGSDHNSTLTTASIRIFRSTDGGVTNSAVITLRTPVASFNVTNPSVQVIKSGANKGRVIVNWSQMRAPLNYEITGPSDVMTIYSDDAKSVSDFATATWSSETKMFPTIGLKNTTSPTSINLGTVGLTQSLTIGTALTDIYVGRRIRIASNANSNNRITGRILSYDSGTGATVVDNIVVGGSGTLTDWNVSLSSYGDSCGKAITLSDNSLLKVMHWTEGLGFNGYVYASTDGITWTYKGTVWDITTEGSGDSHEASLAVQPSTGNIYCYRRNTVLEFIQLSKSTAASAGAAWSAKVQTTVPNIGKCPFLFTANGNIVGLGRNPIDPYDCILWQSHDGGLTHTWENIDARECAYMYGGLVQLADKILARYCIEAQNSVTHQGPTLMIQKDIIESSSLVLPPTAYDPYLQSVFDWAQIDGNTMPSAALKTKLNDWFLALRPGSFLTNIDYLRPALNDATLYAIRDRNWIYPWETATPVNSPTVSAGGYTFNGTTQRVELGNSSRPNGLTKGSQNDISIYFYTPTNTQDAAFGRSFAINSFQLITRASDGNLYFRINDVTNSIVANSGAAGRYFLQRTSSTNKRIWKNGSSLSNPSVASVTLVGQADNMNLGCLNVLTGVTYQNFRAETESMFILGKGFSGSEAAYDAVNLAFLTSIGL